MFPPERLELLRQDWFRLLQRYGVAPALVFPPFELLAAAYTAPDRHYHNLEHLDEVFRTAGRLAAITDDTGPLHLAIWFHDVVYDPRARDNEARSASLAVDLLGPIGVPAAVLDRVTRMIQATAHLGHQEPGDRDTATLLDADLAILGAPEDRYRRYAADIRREYSWVPDAEYRPGRAAVLERFMARPRLYHHELLRKTCEQQAHVNMREELKDLG